MKFLLDTHAFLWYVLDDPKLSPAATAVIEDDTAEILVSPASLGNCDQNKPAQVLAQCAF